MFVISAFTFSTKSPKQDNSHPKVTTLHAPLLAVFGADSFNCDPNEAKHQGRVHHRYNTLHMKEKGPDNIIVHFKSKKYTNSKGRHDNDYVHFDILFKDGKIGPREDTHILITWKDKKYHVKGTECDFNITKLEWDAPKTHFTFSADFSARVTTGGADTTTHIFKGQIVDELVKDKVHGQQHAKK